MHTFFALKDIYSLIIKDNNEKIYFSFDLAIAKPHSALNDYLKT